MRAICWALIAGAWLGISTVQAQEEREVFSDTFDVQAVDVEVIVTDRKGDRVEGLSAADFQLLVDGKAVPVEYFAEIRQGGAVVPQAAEPGAGEAVPGPARVQPGEVVGNSYLIFIDDYFVPPVLRNEALRGLSREVAALRPQDRVAVVSFSGRKVKVLAPWMAPDENVRKLLERLSEQKASLAATPFSVADLEPSANQLLVRYDNAIDPGSDPTSGQVGDGGNPDSGMGDKLTAQAVERSIEAAAASLRTFAAVSGRKILVLLSGGWSYEAARTLKKGLDRYERLRPLIDTSNLLGYTVYPIQLVQQGSAYLPRAGGGATEAAAPIGGVAGSYGSPQQVSLLVTAEDTGGKYLLPGRNRHFSRIVEDTSQYYWLGFTHSGPQQRHSIEVKTTKPGLEVRSRKSFVPLPPGARLDMQIEKVMLTGDTAGMGALAVTAGKLEKTGALGNAGDAAITVRVPVSELTLAQQGKRYTGKLELRIMAIDDEGNRSNVPAISIDVDRDEPPAPGATIRYDTKLRLRYRPHDVQVVLYDTLSGKSFTQKVRVEPGVQ